jgi:hypothetical protein
MQRVVLAFFFVPLFVSFFFGPLFLVVAPIAWLVCLFLAAPLFALFDWKRWLRCWQVVLAGLVCGLVSCGLLMVGDGLYSTVQGPANLAMFGGVGAVIAYGFWWFGLYRNPHFGESTGSSPLPALFPLPVLIGLGLLHVAYTPSIAGAIAMDTPATEIARGIVDVRLADGTLVNATLADSVRPPGIGEKVTVESRSRATLIGKLYWVISRASQVSERH